MFRGRNSARLVAWVVFLALVPAVFRDSRVLLIDFDRYFDPDGSGDTSWSS